MALESGGPNPGIQSPGKAGIPGNLTSVRQPGVEAQKNLRRLMAQGLMIFAQEWLKEKPDPVNMARGKAMVMQAEQARMGLMQSQQPQGATNLSPQTGVPRPVDGAMDPLTHQPGGGGGSGMSPYGAELGR